MYGLLLLLLLLVVSIFLRVYNKVRSQAYEVPEHAKPSLFSVALQELIATAGGIYLSLVLLISFLQINLADKWDVIGVKMDPLAFIALILAIIQPLFIRFYNLIKGGQ